MQYSRDFFEDTFKIISFFEDNFHNENYSQCQGTASEDMLTLI